MTETDKRDDMWVRLPKMVMANPLSTAAVELEDRLRYGSETSQDGLCAASLIASFRAFVQMDAKSRGMWVREMWDASRQKEES